MDPKTPDQSQNPTPPAQTGQPTPATPQTPPSVEQPMAAQPTPPAQSAPAPTTPAPTPAVAAPESTTPPPPPPPTDTTATATTPPPATPPPAKRSKVLPIAIITVLVLLIGGLVFYIMSVGQDTVAPQDTPQPTKSVPTPTATATPTPEAMDLMASPSANSNRFTSDTLGIMFDYAKMAQSTGPAKAVKTYTAGKRVYVYVEGTTPTKGQYVDVLTKLSTDTTLQAVTKVTQSDPTFKNCTLETTKQTNYPSTYEMITPVCTGPGGGISFFLGDTKHPSSLLYFSIGQYAIPAETGTTQKSWQDTARFLNSTPSEESK